VNRSNRKAGGAGEVSRRLGHTVPACSQMAGESKRGMTKSQRGPEMGFGRPGGPVAREWARPNFLSLILFFRGEPVSQTLSFARVLSGGRRSDAGRRSHWAFLLLSLLLVLHGLALRGGPAVTGLLHGPRRGPNPPANLGDLFSKWPEGFARPLKKLNKI